MIDQCFLQIVSRIFCLIFIYETLLFTGYEKALASELIDRHVNEIHDSNYQPNLINSASYDDRMNYPFFGFDSSSEKNEPKILSYYDFRSVFKENRCDDPQYIRETIQNLSYLENQIFHNQISVWQEIFSNVRNRGFWFNLNPLKNFKYTEAQIEDWLATFTCFQVHNVKEVEKVRASFNKIFPDLLANFSSNEIQIIENWLSFYLGPWKYTIRYNSFAAGLRTGKNPDSRLSQERIIDLWQPTQSGHGLGRYVICNWRIHEVIREAGTGFIIEPAAWNLAYGSFDFDRLRLDMYAEGNNRTFRSIHIRDLEVSFVQRGLGMSERKELGCLTELSRPPTPRLDLAAVRRLNNEFGPHRQNVDTKPFLNSLVFRDPESGPPDARHVYLVNGTSAAVKFTIEYGKQGSNVKFKRDIIVAAKNEKFIGSTCSYDVDYTNLCGTQLWYSILSYSTDQ